MKIFIAFFAMISLTVTANLLMKTGANLLIGKEINFLSFAVSWRLVLGLTAFGSAAIIYILILRWLPLNVAQSFAAAQFIAVILASWFFLSEPISLNQWFGIFIIVVGISIVGWFS
jgi:drug/metabolite transporter (DMT)-like permease